MCHKHIPKEYLRREIIRFPVRMYSVLILSSFFAYALQTPEVALDQAFLHLASAKTIQDNFRFPYQLQSHPPSSAVLLYT